MTSKRTPGPFTSEAGGKRGAWIKGSNGHWLALSCGDTDEEAAENTAFIVSACNAHDDLVAAADEALNCLIGCCIPAGGCDDRKTILDTQIRLRKVLEAVGVTYRGEVVS